MTTSSKLILVLFCFVLVTSTSLRADLTVRDVHSTGEIDSLADADALLGGFGVASESTMITSLIDFFDVQGGGGTGHFGNNLAFPNDTAGDDNDFAIQVTGKIFIATAGDWTFGINADDGSRLRVNGVTVIEDDTLHPPQDFFGTTNLSAGWHDIDLIFFERGGGAALEFFAAQGSFTSFAGNDFQLVGDTGNSGLETTAIPEPDSFGVLMGIGLALIIQRRERR